MTQRSPANPDAFLPHLKQLARRIAETAHVRDRDGQWPAQALTALGQAGAWRWAIPREFGGETLSALQQVQAYEAVSRGSLAAALILTQHDGACLLIAGGESQQLMDDLLPRFARGELLATVGISQLTTSKRGAGPPMKARRDGDGFRLDGLMPWVTSSPLCQVIVTGGVLDDGNQILAVISSDRAGVEIHEPMQLAALQASCTGAVHCRDVRVEPHEIIRGPCEQVLSIRAPVKSLTVSACGIGLAGAMWQAIDAIPAAATDTFKPVCDRLRDAFRRLRDELYDAAEKRSDPSAEVPAYEIRSSINDLVQRLAIALMTLAKGTGMLIDHPAQRLAREALFFLVWSAPDPVRQQTLEKTILHPLA